MMRRLRLEPSCGGDHSVSPTQQDCCVNIAGPEGLAFDNYFYNYPPNPVYPRTKRDEVAPTC
jgi:hypothetical protein